MGWCRTAGSGRGRRRVGTADQYGSACRQRPKSKMQTQAGLTGKVLGAVHLHRQPHIALLDCGREGRERGGQDGRLKVVKLQTLWPSGSSPASNAATRAAQPCRRSTAKRSAAQRGGTHWRCRRRRSRGGVSTPRQRAPPASAAHPPPCSAQGGGRCCLGVWLGFVAGEQQRGEGTRQQQSRLDFSCNAAEARLHTCRREVVVSRAAQCSSARGRMWGGRKSE